MYASKTNTEKNNTDKKRLKATFFPDDTGPPKKTGISLSYNIDHFGLDIKLFHTINKN